MKRTFLLVLVMFMLPVASGQELGADSDNERLLTRALKAMAYAPSFKQGVAAEKRQSGKTSAFIEAVLNADNSELERIFARVYRQYLSREHINDLIRFYESPTGKALIAQQASDALNPNPMLRLNPTQMSEVRAFSNSAAGKAFRRVSEDEKIWKEVGQEIRLRLLR